MCKSARWWVAFDGGDLSACRLWVLLLVLGTHYAFVAFNHTMFVFQAYKPQVACQEEAPDGSFIYTAECQANCSGRYTFPSADDDASIVTEWMLVCSRSSLRPLMATLYFLGVAIGALACGLLADRLGRRIVMLSCLVGQAALGAAVSLAPSLEAFAVLRTIHGVFVQGLQGSTFTLLLELFPSHLRTAVGVVLEIYWAVGLAVLAGLAYLLPHWRDLQLAVSAPSFVTILLLPWIPESRLWLASKGHKSPFRRGLPGHGSYRENKAEETDALKQPSGKVLVVRKAEQPDEQPSTVTAVDLVGSGGLRLYTLCMNAIWFTVPLSYYVTTFGMPSLTGNRFANFALGAALEVGAYCVTFVAITRLGRRLPLAAFLACSAVACFGVAFILLDSADNGGVATLMLVLGCKATLVSSFCIMFIYTGELFPTAIRSAALGVCGFVGRIGNLLSPQVVHLGEDGNKWVPFILIGALLLASSLCSLLLPETLGQELPSTLEDARALRTTGHRKKKRTAAGSPLGAEEQLLDQNGVSSSPYARTTKLNLDDYKVPEWKSDIPQLEEDTVQTAKRKGSMTALELGQGILDELNKTPGVERAEKTRSMYLETNLDDPTVGEDRSEYKTTVASAV